jgi:hypothetical protein
MRRLPAIGVEASYAHRQLDTELLDVPDLEQDRAAARNGAYQQPRNIGSATG